MENELKQIVESHSLGDFWIAENISGNVSSK